MIRTVVCGAAGRMGREVVAAITQADDMEVVAAIDRHDAGEDAGTLAGIAALGVPIETDLEAALVRTQPLVLVDFTLPASVQANVELAIAFGTEPRKLAED
jgi:4-hydroxy-tetrahydrodipicolinate reductase